MSISTSNPITTRPPEAQFFLAPESDVHRQYEALRAYFVDGLSSIEVASRFSYSPGAFRVLCHRFRHVFDWQDHFFKEPTRGPQSAPVKDPIRDQAIDLRKKNLSVYDIRREFQSRGIEVSINTLTLLLREEGFSRLPRRREEDRPPSIRAEDAPVADVSQLDLSPRTFRTRMAGLFLFVPLMKDLNISQLTEIVGLPGSKMIPAEQALRSLLALKLVGVERKSHVMDHVFDEGLALFAGLNAIPKRSYLAGYTSRAGTQRNLKLMEVWFHMIQDAGLQRGDSFDLDFHTVPANSLKEPLDKHFVSSRSRSQKGVLVFLARDADERVLCYANAAMPKSKRNDEILRFVDFWKRNTGKLPRELVFDSKLTTQKNLRQLDKQQIKFITLRTRSRQMLAKIYATPSSAWRRIELPSLTRSYRHPKVLDQRIPLRGYGKRIRQLTILDLGHEEPTVLLTNNFKIKPSALITRYAHRMLIENAIAEAIHFFHIDALTSMVGLKVDFDLQLTLMASSLFRLLTAKLPEQYHRSQAKTIYNNLLNVGGTVQITQDLVIVTLDKRARDPFLIDTGLADPPYTPMPWFGHKALALRFS